LIDRLLISNILKQCELLSILRGGLYYKPVSISEESITILDFLDKQYLDTPFYCSRKLVVELHKIGCKVNRKGVKRLMEIMDWRTIYREPKTTIIDKITYKFPYLLKGLNIVRVNQVWAIYITYIPIKKGLYLFAIIDLHSRYVLNWSVSNSITAEWFVETIEEAIKNHGKPEIMNSDQGSQFTSEIYTKTQINNNIKISMGGKGRAIDNIFIERLWRTVKYENVYLNIYVYGLSLYEGLNKYFVFYNTKRPHQSLKYETPIEVFRNVA